MRLIDDFLEGFRLADGEVGQDLAIEFDTGLLHPEHELGIGHAVLTHTGIDPLDPERAEIALLHPAIAVSVLQALLDPFLGNAENVVIPAPIALGGFQDLLATCVTLNGAFLRVTWVSPFSDRASSASESARPTWR